jgi:hypothetical protein
MFGKGQPIKKGDLQQNVSVNPGNAGVSPAYTRSENDVDMKSLISENEYQQIIYYKEITH